MGFPDTSQSLLLRVRDTEDHRSWEQFAEIYSPLIERFCAWRGLPNEDVRDVTQDVLAAVSHAIKKFDYDPQKGAFRAWLLTVTRNKLSTHMAKKNRQPAPRGAQTVVAMLDSRQPPAPEEMDVWERDYRRRLFNWAAEKTQSDFEPVTWKAFWSTAVLGKPGGEVAEDLNLNIGSVYTAKSRVLKRIRERIATVADEWDIYQCEPSQS